MKIYRFFSLSAVVAVAVIASLSSYVRAQTVNASQQVVLEGLLSSAGHGKFHAATYASDGSLLLLLDEHDGVRVLKTDSTGSTLLAQSHMGAAGDSGVAMAMDSSGYLYVAGTTTSGTLAGTSGVPFPSVADASTNSFLAKYDANLNLVFLTFLGSGETSATGIGATADGVFVTGTTFSAALPVTASGIQQTPAKGSSENGFVERFSTDGSTLSYATYLTGVGGNTTPTALVVDSSDAVYVAGSTTASGFPTIAALQPTLPGASSGFLTKLNAAGSAFSFSTFIAGSGITSMAFDASTNSLLLTGNVSLGQFPVATAAMPLVALSYQTLLRLTSDGQTVRSSVLLVPGTESFVSVAPDGGAWISGALSTPLFPGDAAPDYAAGDSFLLHMNSSNAIDQTMRFGGVAVNEANYASLTSSFAAPAVDGSTVTLPGSITTEVSSSLLSTQRFDFPLAAAPNAILTNELHDLLANAATCGSSSLCSGSGALLASVTVATSAPSLSLSVDDLPNLTLRNLGSSTATGMAITASGFTVSSDCGTTLEPSNQCSIALTGTGPGTITVSAANATTATATLPANTMAPNALGLSAGELDFGVVSSVSGTTTQSITVSNLTTTNQTFTSSLDGAAITTYSVTQTASDCAAAGATGTYTVAANSSCHITLGVAASNNSANDGPAHALWKIGTRDVVLTGFMQAAALYASSTEVDFGTQFSGATSFDLPRYLYLSNNSDTAVTHTAATLPTNSPFSVVDGCPSVLDAHSICQLTLHYLSTTVPSSDSATLTLDEGISVLLTGETLSPTSVTGSAVNPNLSVSTTALSFASAIVVTGVSSASQSVTLTNKGTSAFALTLAVDGDFTLTNGCPVTLAGGASCTVQVGFAPSQPGMRDGLLSITAGSGFTPTYVTLSGTGTAILPPNNGTLALGQTLVGEPLVVWYQIQQPLASLTVTSGNPAFGLALVTGTNGSPGSLPASSFGQSVTGSCTDCWLGVQFLSQNAGTQAAALTLTTVAGGSPYVLTLTATALPVQGLLLTPIEQDFGTVAVHSSSAPMLFTLANFLAGASGVTVQSVTASGDFTIAPNTTGGAACSGTLASTASCYMQVVFSPTATGSRSGTLTVVTSGGTVTAVLNGYGADDPGLAIDPLSLTFANVPGSAATQQTITLTNTGSANLSIGTPVSTATSFAVVSNCSVLLPGAGCSLAVTFTPQPATVAATLTLPVTVTINGQTSTLNYSVALSGSYTSEDAGLQILSNEANYGATSTSAVGITQEFTMNNLTDKTLNMTLRLPRQFPLASSTACPTLAPGASCSFSVSFLPVTGGDLTGSVIVQGTPTDGSAAVQALSYVLGYGVATGALTITGGAIPYSPVSFAQVSSGQSSQQTLTLTNSGSGSLTLRRISTAPPFYSTTTCGTLLPPNGSCTVTLTYAPLDEISSNTTPTPRTDNGTLVLESDAVTSPNSVALTGTVLPVISTSPASSAVLDSYALSNGALTFANTQVGNVSAAQVVTLTNNGTATIHVLSTLTATDFTSSTTCGTLLPGATCTFNVEFSPTTASTSTVRSGTLEIQSDASTSLEFISLIGTSAAAPLTLNPTSLNFGTVSVGSSETLDVSVTNNAGSPVTFTGVTLSGDYSSSRGTCPANGATLAGGSSCTLSVIFTPTATGTRSGTLSLLNDATQVPLTVSLTGSAVTGSLKVTPGALSFSSIDVGATASLTLTLLNTGAASVSGITNAISGVNAGDFAVTAPCSTTSLAPNQGCTETVTFTPAATGSRVAQLSVASSDPSGPAVIALSGTGVQAGSFVLTVNGASSATVTVKSGSPATFALLLTPLNGFTGNVALTCTPVVAAQYANCSLLASTLTLGAAQSSTATINTITKQIAKGFGGFALILLPFATISRRRRRMGVLSVLKLGVVCLAFSGCGGGPSTGGYGLLYSPAGTYQYQVTASSTSGTPVSSSVTLNLIVQ